MGDSVSQEKDPSEVPPLISTAELATRIRAHALAAAAPRASAKPHARPLELAFLLDGSRALYSLAAPTGMACFSAPWRLIEAVHATFPARARAISRARIYTDSPVIGAALRGMIKVVGKRISSLTDGATSSRGATAAAKNSMIASPRELVGLPTPAAGPYFRALPEGELWPLSRASAAIDAARMKALCELAERLSHRARAEMGERHRDRPIAALLISRDGELLGWAPNSNSLQRTQHAEVNLVCGYLALGHESLPVGATIVSSLKPCQMCAGLLAEGAAASEGVRVFYGFDDPGPRARRTALDSGKIQSGPWLNEGFAPTVGLLAE